MGKRELWVDNIKVIACMLVLLGHLMRGMASGGIIPAEGVYTWFDQTVYYFHVPLFFICSGYLHQKFNHIDSLDAWLKNILRKFLSLGVPYTAFTFAMWLIKKVFPGSGSNEIGGLLEALFFRPIGPYWYLYCLFFIFVVTGTFKNKRRAVFGTIVALGMKGMSVFGIGERYCYAISIVLENEIWFVLGMLLCVVDAPERIHKKTVFMRAGLAFLVLSMPIAAAGIACKGITFLMGLLSCFAVIGTVIARDKDGRQSVMMRWLSKYTLPIYLMHFIFAATLRSILLKIGVTSAWIHIPAGIVISITGPVTAAFIMKKLKYPEFFLYPGKFVKIE